MNLFNWLFRSRDKPKNYLGGLSFLFGDTTAGQTVNEKTSMQLTAVYACVRVLAESIAGLPVHIYRNNGKGKERVTDHPLCRILHDEPNPDMTSFVFRETMMSHLLLWGNAYAQILKARGGQVIGLFPLLPDKMKVDRDPKTKKLVYTYTKSDDQNPNFKGASQIELKQEQVLHIPGLSFDGLVGYSPIALAKNTVGMALACDEYGAKFFENGARPGGILKHPGVLKDPAKVRENWQAVYGGAGNTGRVAVLEEGMEYQPLSLPPEEAQFLQTRKFQIEEIARLFRIPPHMLGDLDRATFANIEQPWVIRWEQALQKALLSDKEKEEYFIRFNVDGLLRGDYASRMQGYSIGRQNGWLSVNDIRELEDMNPLPEGEGGELYLVNGNMTKLKDAGIFAIPAGNGGVITNA